MTHKLRSLFRALFVDGSAPSIFGALIPPRQDVEHPFGRFHPGPTATRAARDEDAEIQGSPSPKGNARLP